MSRTSALGLAVFNPANRNLWSLKISAATKPAASVAAAHARHGQIGTIIMESLTAIPQYVGWRNDAGIHTLIYESNDLDAWAMMVHDEVTFNRENENPDTVALVLVDLDNATATVTSGLTGQAGTIPLDSDRALAAYLDEVTTQMHCDLHEVLAAHDAESMIIDEME